MQTIANQEGMRLQRFAAELSRIADNLLSLPDMTVLGDASVTMPISTKATVSSVTIRAMIKKRRMRERYFPQGLFADPVWDILLDLMAARLEGVRVAVSSLCIASAVPPTTAIRWIQVMSERGLVRRIADPHDGRRVYIDLTESAAISMITLLEDF